ncbi:ABC transporter permease subunit [Saccharopolyspora hirsuta]|uniref:ABC transporter permease subunit n=1 Tax=Saccharopolyspora hirsuta TaxID=1837 RepID=UPI00331C226C
MGAMFRPAALASRFAAVAALVLVVGMLPWLSGGDPALSVLRARSAERDPDPEALAAIRDQLGLDAGPLVLLGRWLTGLASGDAGTSWVSGKPVLPGVLAGLGVSLTLMAGAIVVAVLVAGALVAPTLAAASRGRPRSASGAVAAMLTAVPEFLLASVLLIVFAVWLRWAPPFGWEGPENLVLPAIAMGVPAGGLLGRLLDDALPAAAGEQWTTTWTVLGVGRARIAGGVLRRSLPALLPQLALVVVGLVGGAVAVEELFAIPGIGRMALGAAVAQDLPLLQACLLVLLLTGFAASAVSAALHLLLIGRALRGTTLPVAQRAAAGPGRLARVLPVVFASALILLVAVGLFRDPTAVDVSLRLAAPSWERPLGADALGRDMLARVAHGALRTALVALLVTAVALVLGLGLGFLPRLSGGPVEVLNAMPPVLAGLITAAVLGPSTAGAAVAVVLVAWAPLAAHTTALVREERAATHVQASRVAGGDRSWILRAHVLPAVFPPVFRHALLRLPGTALALASLGFLGLGAQPPEPEWGLVLSEAMPYVERAPWAALAPTAALALLGALAVSTSSLGRRIAVGG